MAVKGLQQTLRGLAKMNELIQDDIKDIIEDGVQTIYKEARKLAPGPGDPIKLENGTLPNTGGISQFIDFVIQNKGFSGQVFIEQRASLMAIYCEFGTGASASSYLRNLPADIQAIAMTFFIDGKGRIIAQPFLLPAFFSARTKILKAMKYKLESHGVKVNLIY